MSAARLAGTVAPLAVCGLLAVAACDGPAVGSWTEPGSRTATTIHVADHQRDGRTDAQAIQAAIDAASPGDTVYFDPGTYELDEPFRFASGVTYVGSSQPPAVLRGTGATQLVLHYTGETPLHEVTIRSLQFDNIQLRLAGSGSYTDIRDVTLQDCVFRNGRGETPWSTPYLRLAYTARVTVDGCTFLRDADAPGRGLWLYRNRLTVIKDSFIGTTPDLEDGAPNGHFTTAINVFGYDPDTGDRNREILIDGNVWRRAAGIDCPEGATCEDHGLYAWGVDGLVLRGNRADGWTATSSGGAMKLRNADRVVVVDNRLMRSGIMAYTHVHADPDHFRQVRIEGNRVDLLGDDAAVGIFYRRADENGSSHGRFCDDRGAEADIVIARNRFVGGGQLDVRCADGREICVRGNTGAERSLLTRGVRTSGCGAPESLSRTPAGVFRGDFNGDDRPDFIHVATSDAGDPYWRAHLSHGEGFTEQSWAYDLRPADGWERYGLHVADFNGDGRDDLAYRGVCGDAPCWRVHHGTGSGFTTGVDYGDGVRRSDETFRLGVRKGDFDGDGRADLVFRGLCGRDAHPCWRVLGGRPEGGFAVRDWGDGGYPDPGHTGDYGLLVGDYDGDGRDDVAYRGLCGSTEPCVRMHLSTPGDRFRPHHGGRFRPDGAVTGHLGMRVVDADGDGRDDVAYRGRCGDDGDPGWRIHLGGTGPPSRVVCTPDLPDPSLS